MSNSDQTLTLYAAIAASAQSVSEQMQAEMVRLAGTTKSAAGDRVLARLARRTDITAATRTAVEKSPRAAVKSAWLSRTDHPSGYVEAAIAAETRVTVLKAVAEHEDTSPEMLTMLAKTQSRQVAQAILARSDAPAEAATSAMSTLLACYANLSYADKSQVAAWSTAHQDTWEQVVATVTDKVALSELITSRGIHIPASQVARIAQIVLGSWQAEFDPNDSYAYYDTPNRRLGQACAALLESPAWVEDSPEDELAATVLNALRSTKAGLTYYRSTAMEDCINRFFGTAADRAAAEKRKKTRLATLHAAATTSDATKLVAFSTSRDTAVIAALAENPNLRLEHLTHAYEPGLVELCVNNGGSRAMAAGIQLANSYYGWTRDWLSELDESELDQAADIAMRIVREDGRSYMFSHQFVRMMQVPRIGKRVISQVSVPEIINVLNSNVLTEDLLAVVAQSVADTIGDYVTDAEGWEMFSSLASAMETATIAEAAQVATSV